MIRLLLGLGVFYQFGLATLVQHSLQGPFGGSQGSVLWLMTLLMCALGYMLYPLCRRRFPLQQAQRILLLSSFLISGLSLMGLCLNRWVFQASAGVLLACLWPLALTTGFFCNGIFYCSALGWRLVARRGWLLGSSFGLVAILQYLVLVALDQPILQALVLLLSLAGLAWLFFFRLTAKLVYGWEPEAGGVKQAQEELRDQESGNEEALGAGSLILGQPKPPEPFTLSLAPILIALLAGLNQATLQAAMGQGAGLETHSFSLWGLVPGLLLAGWLADQDRPRCKLLPTALSWGLLGGFGLILSYAMGLGLGMDRAGGSGLTQWVILLLEGFGRGGALLYLVEYFFSRAGVEPEPDLWAGAGWVLGLLGQAVALGAVTVAQGMAS